MLSGSGRAIGECWGPVGLGKGHKEKVHAHNGGKGRVQSVKRGHEGRTEECVAKERQARMHATRKQSKSDRYRIQIMVV